MHAGLTEFHRHKVIKPPPQKTVTFSRSIHSFFNKNKICRALSLKRALRIAALVRYSYREGAHHSLHYLHWFKLVLVSIGLN